HRPCSVLALALLLAGAAAGQPAAADLQELWKDLADPDAARAHRALWALVATPGRSVPFLHKHLEQVTAVGPRQIARLVDDLGSSAFAARERATRELEKLGPLAEPALKKLLASRPPPEARLRAERLLDKLHRLSLPADELRAGRALEVLELVGN